MAHAPLQLGVLGAAKIARLFIDAVRPSRKIVVAAVASRDAERAGAFARDWRAAQVVTVTHIQDCVAQMIRGDWWMN